MWTIPPSPHPYRYGNLPDALRAAAREILDEGGAEGVLLREVTRRVGVTSAAAYRHFHGKEGLLASVATEGFRDLAAAMQGAAAEADPLTRARLAYVQFALQKRGLFRMMFGPILAERAKYPELSAAFNVVQRMVTGIEGPPSKARRPSRRGDWFTGCRPFLSTIWFPRRERDAWRKKSFGASAQPRDIGGCATSAPGRRRNIFTTRAQSAMALDDDRAEKFELR